MTSIEELKNSSETLQKELDKPETIQRIISLYEDSTEQPKITFMNSEAEAFFRSVFTSKVIQCVLNITSLNNSECKEAIAKLLRTFVEFLVRELKSEKVEVLEIAQRVFSPDNYLYKEVFGDLKTELYKYEQVIDPEWRANLKEGDELDVLKEEIEAKRIEGWVVATIKKVVGERLVCTFDGMPEEDTTEYEREGTKICPLGSRTKGWEWRSALKPGDIIDVLDTQAKWFLGTVLEAKVENGIKKILACFRVYLPNGSKSDKEGKAYEGWSDSYDAWFPAHSIKIQPPNSITKHGTVYCSHMLDDESPAPDDSSDMLQNYPSNNLPCVIHRFGKSYSSLYLELINTFESKDGFRQILYLIKNTKNIEDIFLLVGVMAAPNMLYHKMYVDTMIKRFVESVMEYISSIPIDQVRFIHKGKLGEFLVRLEELMRRVYTSKTKGELLIKLRMEISISLLRAEQLEKRIEAIKLIAETCKSAKASQESYRHTRSPRANDPFVLSNLLKVPQLISEIFGKRSHIELIQRSTEILRFLFLFSKITKEDFNVIWECCVNDEQSKIEILKVISDNSNLFPGELIGLIVEKYVALPKSELKDQDIEILCEFTKNYTQQNSEALEEILDMLWELIKNRCEGFPGEIYERVMCRFCDVIVTPSRVPEDIMKKYFNQCYKMIETGENVVIGLEVVRRSMIQLNCTKKDMTTKEFLFNLLAEGNAIENFFKDFDRYFITTMRNTNLEEHKKEVRERKCFLIFLLKHTGYKLTKENITILWNNLIQRAIIYEDQKTFYEIFKQIIHMGIEEHVVSMDDVKDSFINVLCNDDNNFQILPIEGIQVIESLLIIVNRITDKIVEIGVVKKKTHDQMHGRYGGMIGPMAPPEMNQEEEIEFRVKVLPSELIGASTLWKIVLEATNEQVTISAIELISKIYTKLSEDLENKISEISSSFIEMAIKQLKLCYQTMMNININRSNEIVKILRLIEQMLDESEKKGNGGITPLNAIMKGSNLNLTIKNHAVDTFERPDIPDTIDLTVHRRTTYWQLIMLVARRLGMEPERVNIKFPGIEISNKENAKALEDLGVLECEYATARKSNRQQMPRLSLTKSGTLTAKARAVFVEVFERFSKEGKMDTDCFTEFSRVCLCDKTIKSTNHQIKEVFDDYDRGNKGYLTLDSFLHFYECSSMTIEEVVWSNLRELGYGHDLEKFDETKGITITIIERERLPRYLLANNSEYLSFIFSLASINSI